MEKYKINVNGKEYLVTLEPVTSDTKIPTKLDSSNTTSTNYEIIKSPMQGNILEIKASLNQKVQKGDILIILEAMKMENEILAPTNGTIKNIKIKVGDSVNNNDVLLEMETH